MQYDTANQLVLDDPTDVAARADLIDNTNWCNGFAWRQIELMARFFEVMHVRSDVVIFHEGDRDAYMCLVAEGVVHISKENSGPDAKVLATLGPGKTFGEMSLVDGQPRSATAIVREDATLLVMTDRKFKAMCNDFPRLGVKLLLMIASMVSQRLRQTSGQVVDFL